VFDLFEIFYETIVKLLKSSSLGGCFYYFSKSDVITVNVVTVGQKMEWTIIMERDVDAVNNGQGEVINIDFSSLSKLILNFSILFKWT
jgi:hypothetical protein